MNIAIYNGNLNPTTFISRLAQVVGKSEQISVVGASKKFKKFKKNGILYLPTYHKNKWLVMFQLGFQLGVFFITHTKICCHFVSLLYKADKPFLVKARQFLIWSKLIQNKFDVIHIQWVSHITFFEEIIDFSYFKFVVSLRGRLLNSAPLSDKKLQNLYLNTFPKIDKFHAVSHDIKQNALKYGAKKENIEVIYSGIDTNAHTSKRLLKRDHSETIHMLSVGRAHWIKGYNYALEAVKRLKDQNIKINYTIIGGSDSEELLVMIQELGISEDVNLLPRLSYEKVLKSMHEADIFLLPSVSEGLANVAIEAMLVGLPIISSNTGGMPELVEHQKTGLVFENRNITKLVDVILDFISMSEEELEQMINHANQKVREQHGLIAFETSFNQFYNSIQLSSTGIT